MLPALLLGQVFEVSGVGIGSRAWTVAVGRLAAGLIGLSLAGLANSCTVEDVLAGDGAPALRSAAVEGTMAGLVLALLREVNGNALGAQGRGEGWIQDEFFVIPMHWVVGVEQVSDAVAADAVP